MQTQTIQSLQNDWARAAARSALCRREKDFEGRDHYDAICTRLAAEIARRKAEEKPDEGF